MPERKREVERPRRAVPRATEVALSITIGYDDKVASRGCELKSVRQYVRLFNFVVYSVWMEEQQDVESIFQTADDMKRLSPLT